MKILRSRSTKIVLVKQNQIPITKAANTKYVNDLVKIHSFAAVNQLQDPATGNLLGINFNNGLYVTESGREISIENLTIESRKINIQVESSSESADAFYDIVKKYLFNLAEITQEDFLVPVVAVDETELISELQFFPHDLFSKLLYEQISDNLLTKASNEIANARLGTAAISFALDYDPIDFALVSDNRLNITRKEFGIQVAAGYGVEDRVYASKAPLSTEKHIQFLEDLERILKP